ncbi:MAG: hypothetical protein MJ252_27935 [archaeon]|nr:hypothetical protein [archaeon]
MKIDILLLQFVLLFLLKSILTAPEEAKAQSNENKNKINEKKEEGVNKQKGAETPKVGINGEQKINPGEAPKIDATKKPKIGMNAGKNGEKIDPKMFQQNQRKYQNPYESVNPTPEESDKLLACSFFFSKKWDEVKDTLNETLSKQHLSLPVDHALSKISYEKLYYCFSTITSEDAHVFFRDLVFLTDKGFEKYYNKYIPFNFSVYDPTYNYQPTTNETITAYKLEKARNKYENKRVDEYKGTREYTNIAGYSLNNINKNISVCIFLAIIALFTFGVIFMLKKVNNSGKKIRDKKKKRN